MVRQTVVTPYDYGDVKDKNESVCSQVCLLRNNVVKGCSSKGKILKLLGTMMNIRSGGSKVVREVT